METSINKHKNKTIAHIFLNVKSLELKIKLEYVPTSIDKS